MILFIHVYVYWFGSWGHDVIVHDLAGNKNIESFIIEVFVHVSLNYCTKYNSDRISTY